MFYFYSEGKKLRLPIKQIIYAEILNHDLDECRVNSFKELHAMIHRKLVRKILEVLSNALSVISNFTSNIVVKIVIIIIILGAWIFRYAKKIDIKSS